MASPDIKMELIKTKTVPDCSDSRNIVAYVKLCSSLQVLVSEDNTPKWGWLKHVSISRPTRYPDWDEILEVKEQLFGDVDVMMVMPKKEDYVNVHPYCFHLWQTPEEWAMR